MFMRFFTELREAKVPVTLKEYLMLMEALDKAVIGRNVEEFYYLARSALVKDEKNLDRFDQVFGHVFKGLEKLEGFGVSDIPAEWLKKISDQFLTDEEKAQIEAMGGFEKLMEALAEQMREQRENGDDGEGEGKGKGKGGQGPGWRGGRARHGRHDPRYGGEGLSRHQAAARAPQQDQRPDLLRRRRLNGQPYQGL
jgi:hypothetical protein